MPCGDNRLGRGNNILLRVIKDIIQKGEGNSNKVDGILNKVSNTYDHKSAKYNINRINIKIPKIYNIEYSSTPVEILNNKTDISK